MAAVVAVGVAVSDGVAVAVADGAGVVAVGVADSVGVAAAIKPRPEIRAHP